MSFWLKIKNVKNNLKTSLRANQRQIYPNMINAGLLNPKSKVTERTFSFSPSELKASICVEASLSFSFFLFFFVNIFFIITSFSYFSKDLISLQQQGKQTAAYAYMTKGMWEENEDLIVLQKQRVINSPFSILPVPQFKIAAKCVVKPWVGYEVAKGKDREEEEIFVYVTEYGSVYHKQRNCTYLALSISITSMTEVGKEKNASGKSYQACELCGKNNFVSAVYITSYGTKFHTTINCSGLKRTVKSVPLSEVEGKGACSKCG